MFSLSVVQLVKPFCNGHLGHLEVTVVERWQSWGGSGVNVTPVFFFPRVQLVVVQKMLNQHT